MRDCIVAVVQVEPADNPPVKADGRCWIRTGPRRDQATADDERRLTEKRRWGHLPYDMQGVPGATVEADLDMRAFENDYLPCAVSPEVLAENRRDSEEQLRALRLVARDGAPTVTAILVLGRDSSGLAPRRLPAVRPLRWNRGYGSRAGPCRAFRAAAGTVARSGRRAETEHHARARHAGRAPRGGAKLSLRGSARAPSQFPHPQELRELPYASAGVLVRRPRGDPQPRLRRSER